LFFLEDGIQAGIILRVEFCKFSKFVPAIGGDFIKNVKFFLPLLLEKGTRNPFDSVSSE